MRWSVVNGQLSVTCRMDKRHCRARGLLAPPLKFVIVIEAERSSVMRFMPLILAMSSLLLTGCRRGEESQPAPVAVNRNEVVTVNASEVMPCIDLNKASAAELMELPGVGESMSHRIIAYREQHGRFRRPAEIILVEGFSEKKYRAIADRVCAE